MNKVELGKISKLKQNLSVYLQQIKELTQNKNLNKELSRVMNKSLADGIQLGNATLVHRKPQMSPEDTLPPLPKKIFKPRRDSLDSQSNSLISTNQRKQEIYKNYKLSHSLQNNDFLKSYSQSLYEQNVSPVPVPAKIASNTLTLVNYKLNHSLLLGLRSCFSQMRKVTGVLFKSNGLTEKEGLTLFQIITSNPDINNIVYEQNTLTTHMVKALEPYTQSTTLTELSFSEARCQESTLKPLIHFVCALKGLRVLKLKGMRLNNGHVRTLSDLITSDFIQHLDLSWNHINSAGGKRLMTALSSNESLRSLNLSYNRLATHPVFAQRLSIVLKVHSTLAELNISYTELSEVSLFSLQESLKLSKSLLVLHFTGHHVSQEALQRFLKGLEIYVFASQFLVKKKYLRYTLSPQEEEVLCRSVVSTHWTFTNSYHR